MSLSERDVCRKWVMDNNKWIMESFKVRICFLERRKWILFLVDTWWMLVRGNHSL